MYKHYVFFLTIIFGIAASPIAISEEAQYQIKPAPMALKYFVALEGVWVGTQLNHQGEKKMIELVYRTVSGGTAVEEKIFVNTPQEMVTMYYGDDDGGLLMTHYCMLGNQPRLKLENSHEIAFNFKYLDGVGIDREKTAHMGGMRMTILNENTIEQEWDYFEEGKVKNTSSFIFTRK
ncbi:MAG: hypothetical protein O6852_06850 [Gammaproteobacteria bacterium]|nr:hypothetical protein [Gammaproteobacteria bacterium]